MGRTGRDSQIAADVRELLCDYLKRHNLSYGKAAKQFGISTSIVRRLAIGEANDPGCVMLERFAEYMGYELVVRKRRRESNAS